MSQRFKWMMQCGDEQTPIEVPYWHVPGPLERLLSWLIDDVRYFKKYLP